MTRRAPRIVSDLRPFLRQRFILLPPSRRANRITGNACPDAILNFEVPPEAIRTRRRKRSARIVQNWQARPI